MRHIYSIVLTMLLIGSCSGFLEENPETMLSEASVYRTEESLESSIRGIMNAFYSGSMYTHDMQEFMQTASCLVFFPMSNPGTYNTNERYYSSYHYSQSSTTKLNNEIYANHYVGISRCNKLIEGLAGSPAASWSTRTTTIPISGRPWAGCSASPASTPSRSWKKIWTL